MPRSARRSALVARIAIWSALALVLIMLATAWARDWSQQAAPRESMRRAEASGAYHFAADVSQKTIPLPSVLNVGRRSQDEMFHLEGRTDRSSQTMEMRLWGDGGSVLDPGTGTELKVQGDETFARHTGQEWQKVDSFTGLFAPQGDFFGLLAAARDFSPIDGGEGGVQRYSFRLDGTAFAKLMRDQLEQTMREKGQLPSGVNLDLPQVYVHMEGQGELWIGDDGLPARQIVHLVLPAIPGRDERVEADITITFAQFAPVAAGFNLANWLPTTQMLQNAIWAALILALTTVLLRKHRSRPVYAALAGTVVLSLVTSPVLQGLKIAQFNTTQAAQAAEQRQQQSETDAQRQARDQMLSSSFDPRSSPLQPAPAPANMAGLPNLSTLLDSTTDTDSDGLPDELEDRIGTSPTADDTDGDSISDAQEARGFSFGSGMWYLDPREMDSNKDGIDDRREWRRDANLGQTPQDTDGDGTPDLFDADNDNDGVHDRYDLSPFQKQAALGPSQPFQFRVPDLQPGVPAFVEFQIRPADTKHLWYALNVLDWPNEDRKGQIQDKDGKTFADTGDRIGAQHRQRRYEAGAHAGAAHGRGQRQPAQRGRAQALWHHRARRGPEDQARLCAAGDRHRCAGDTRGLQRQDALQVHWQLGRVPRGAADLDGAGAGRSMHQLWQRRRLPGIWRAQPDAGGADLPRGCLDADRPEHSRGAWHRHRAGLRGPTGRPEHPGRHADRRADHQPGAVLSGGARRQRQQQARYRRDHGQQRQQHRRALQRRLHGHGRAALEYAQLYARHQSVVYDRRRGDQDDRGHDHPGNAAKVPHHGQAAADVRPRGPLPRREP